MVKKVLAIVLCLFCMTGLKAQTESTISANDILYWVGSGTSSAIFVVDYGTGAVAWGYHFNAADDETVDDMVTAISNADPRFYSGYGMLAYTCYPVDADMSYAYFFKVNGVLADDDDEFSDYDLANNMLVKVSQNTEDVWSTPITPATVMHTPEDATIAASDILYWVGEGTDSLVFAVNWGVPDTALAWGLKFSGELTIDGALRAICAADSRLSADSPLTTINYNDGTVNLSFSPSTTPINMPQYILNGNGNVNATTPVANGDFLKIGESLYGFGFDSVMGFAMGVVWPTEIHPVNDPSVGPIISQPEEATISAEQIVYWVGNGDNKVVLAVNWADTALAWGYKFSTDSVTVQQVMDAIMAADPRFSYTMDGNYLGDIHFAVAAGDTLGKVQYSYWESKNNGIGGDAGLYQNLGNNDFEKWAEPAAGVVIDSFSYEWQGVTYWSYIYVYPMAISPVSVPVGIASVQMMTVNVWPNPATLMINVRFDAQQTATEAALYDLTGRQLVVRPVAAGSSEVSLPVSQLADGAYLLRVGQAVAKVVVRH